MKEESRDPENGTVQLLQAQEEVVTVLDGEQVVIILLEDAGVESGEIRLMAHVLLEDLGGGKVAAEDKVRLVNLWPAGAPSENAAVAHHCTHVVVLVLDGRGLRKQ